MSVLPEMEKGGKKGSTGKWHHNAHKENDQRSRGLCHVRINNNNLHIYFIGQVHWRRKNKFKILYICVVAVHVFFFLSFKHNTQMLIKKNKQIGQNVVHKFVCVQEDAKCYSPVHHHYFILFTEVINLFTV